MPSKHEQELGLPRVVLEHGDYRLVGTTVILTGEQEHTERWHLDLVHPPDPLIPGVSTLDAAALCIIAEKRTRDALGNDQWNKCSIVEARTNIITGQIKDCLRVKTSKAEKATK